MNTEKLLRYLIPGALLTAGFLVFLFLGLNKISTISDLRDEISLKETRLVNLKEKSTELADLLAFKSSLEENRDVFQYAIPVEASAPTFMTQVEDIAYESNVSLVALQFAGEAKRTTESVDSPKVKLSVSVNGSFDDIRLFLRNLEISSRLVIVDSIRFSIGFSRVEEGNAPLTANISLFSPYISEIPETEAESPLALDPSDSEFISVLNRVKELKVYARTVDPTGVGKQDPFAR